MHPLLPLSLHLTFLSDQEDVGYNVTYTVDCSHLTEPQIVPEPLRSQTKPIQQRLCWASRLFSHIPVSLTL